MYGRIGSGGGIRTHDLWVMSPTSCRCSTPRRRMGKRTRGETRGWCGGAGGGAAREGRISREVALPVLRRRWRGARPGSGWDRVEHRRARSRPAPPPPPVQTIMQRASPRENTQKTYGNRPDTDLRRRGPPPRLVGKNRPRPCAPLRSNGCPLSTRGRSTRWSAGGLTCSRQERSVISRWGSHLDALSGSPIPT